MRALIKLISLGIVFFTLVYALALGLYEMFKQTDWFTVVFIISCFICIEINYSSTSK